MLLHNIFHDLDDRTTFFCYNKNYILDIIEKHPGITFSFFWSMLPCTYIVDPWTTQELGKLTPSTIEILCITLTPPKHRCPLVSMKNWFQNPLRITKCINAQVLYIKCHRSIHVVSPPHPRITNYESKTDM